MKKLIIGASIAAVLTLSGCTGNEVKTAATYESIVAEAKAAQEVSVKGGHVWKQKKMKTPYVEHYLALAEEAKKKGDEAAALKHAKNALKTANAQVAQINDNADLKAAWSK